MAYFIGLDLGGTNLKAGIVDDQGRPHHKLSTPTRAEQGPQRVVDVLATSTEQLLDALGVDRNEVAGVGVGAPGVIDHRAGVVIGAPNLKDFHEIPLRDMLAERIGMPVHLENDANAAAMGEFWVGAGRDDSVRNLIMLTLGTGIGGGIIIDGHVFRGGSGVGAEVGHMIVEPEGRLDGCGQRGCLEAYASATGTVARTEEAIAALNEHGRGNGRSTIQETTLQAGQVTAHAVFEAAKQGDALAGQIVDETAKYLGIACVSLSRVLDPDMFVFAGGMALAGDFLLERIRAHYRQQYWTITEPRAEIVGATLGNDAGFIGAAAVAWDAEQSERSSVESRL